MSFTQMVQQVRSSACLDVLKPEPCAEKNGTPKVIKDKPLTSFLALPVEIRQHVYEFFFPSTPIEARDNPMYMSTYCWQLPSDARFPSLLGTCTQIHDELAPMVYKRVLLAYDVHNPYDNCPGDWLYAIGRNVSYIQHCEIEYQAIHYTPIPLSTLLEESEEIDYNFPFYNAIKALYEYGDSLRTITVSIGRPRYRVPYFRPPTLRWDDAPTPWRYDMKTEEDREAMRREFFPEIVYTLRQLKWFDWVEKIIITDKDRTHLFGPVLPYYLRGQMGFDFDKISTRAEELSDGFDEFRELGWRDGEAPRVEHWELVNPMIRRRGGGGTDAIFSQNKTWILSSYRNQKGNMGDVEAGWWD